MKRIILGAYADVGGGYPDRRLSDITPRWMQDHAAALGLGLSPVTPGDANFLASPTDSYSAFLGGLFAAAYPPYYRRVLGIAFGNEVVDPTIDRRRTADPDDRPPNVGLPPLRG
jgi:hypothetical protein